HPAHAVAAAAWHPSQAQPAAGEHRGQAARRRGRLDRPRQHAARDRVHAARGGCGRGPRADLLAPRQVALLLRDRLRHARGAHRERARHGRDLRQPGRGLAGLHLPGRHDRRHPPARGGAVHRMLLRKVPDPRRGAGDGTHTHEVMDMTGSTGAAPAQGTTYAAAGVDVEAGDRAVELMKSAVAATHGPEVVGGFGGFAGLFDASALKDYRQPQLATSTDGVGTKVALAQQLDIHDTIGHDLVGMVVDDIVVIGAKPLFMTDYIACGRVIPERIAAIVRGIAEACASAGVALVGGETAEHPGLLGVDEYDVAGAATGVVEADEVLGAYRVEAGDVLVGLPSSGLHANGYSLVRRIIADAGWALDREVPEFGRTLGEEVLTPTRVYAGPLLAL